jgi:pimeloyl-ACP methyl ester carboxylesterase
LLRREVIDPFVEGATTYRVLYTSRDLDGTPAAASGLVIVPDDGEVPAGGRPILAFTHGTIGVARSCAPSLLDDAYVEQMWGLDAFLDAGWIVAAPDYLGLGSEGDHPYLVGPTAADNTLDAVRAAIGLAREEASSRFAVAGHSQGGHAAMFTGQRAPIYAPELDLVGVAGLAPASELAAFIEANDGTTFGNLLGAYAVVAWDRVFDDIDATDIVDPAVLPIVERLADACVATGPEALSLLTDAELLQLGFLVSPIWETEPWASRITENTPGAEPIDAPLLIVQGTDDVLIRPDIQRRFVTRLCDNGQQLEYREFADVGHLGVDDAADDDVVEWLTDRLTTPPTRNICSREEQSRIAESGPPDQLRSYP